MHQPNHNSENPEAGFALYLAIGFIVLISVLAGSVGTNLNVAALSEARKNDRRGALDDAEAGLANGWSVLSDNFTLDNTWDASSIAASDADIAADRTKCVAPYEATPSAFYAGPRASNGQRARRYFIARIGATAYRIYGCGFDARGTRVAFGIYDISGSTLTLNRLRRY